MREQTLEYAVSVLKGEEVKGIYPDWYELTGFLISHRVAGLFYVRMKGAGMRLAQKIETVLRREYETQARRTRFMRRYIRELSSVLMKAEAEHIFLKGSVLSNAMGGEGRLSFYGAGERASNDMDILVRPDRITAAAEVLKKLGYVQGRYEPKSGSIQPFTRAEILSRRMNRGETAPFLKLTGNVMIPYVEADINFSLGATPAEYTGLLSEMLSGRRKYEGKLELYSAEETAFFVQLLLHQYKESRTLFMVNKGKDLDLYKLADIYYYWHSGLVNTEELERLLREHKAEAAAGAVLGQVGRVFRDEDMLFAAGEYGKAVPEVLDYTTGKTYRWTADERKRLCRADTRYLLEETDDRA